MNKKLPVSKTSKIVKIKQMAKNPIQSRRVLTAIFIVLIIMTILILVNFFSLLQTRKELKSYLESATVFEKAEPEEVKTEAPKITKRVSSWQSFGDSFSSGAYLNTAKTDMFLDDKVTSLIFPPVYDFTLVKDCNQENCNLSGSNLVFLDKNIFQKPTEIPTELKNKNIVFSRLDKLSLRSIASFIILENGEEHGYIYFVDGRKLTPIINDSTEAKILTKYGRGGGAIAIGGDDNDFIILYSGYEGQAFHYKNNNLEDISRFFGLRVMDNGFPAYITKQGQGNNSLWYILSLNSAKPKLIKLWQNGTEKIVGAYDFSGMFSDKEGALMAFQVGGDSGNVRREVNFIFKNEQVLSSLYSLSKFSDEGFDNSRKRSALSVNLNSGPEKVLRAKIDSIGIYGEATVFLADSAIENNFVKASQSEIIEFDGNGNELFWRLDFPKKSDKEYSPWFDHVNYLNYYVKGE
jgi:hypothetical protein